MKSQTPNEVDGDDCIVTFPNPTSILGCAPCSPFSPPPRTSCYTARRGAGPGTGTIAGTLVVAGTCAPTVAASGGVLAFQPTLDLQGFARYFAVGLAARGCEVGGWGSWKEGHRGPLGDVDPMLDPHLPT